jgi:DNA-binding GntR family transcriptional regulator
MIYQQLREWILSGTLEPGQTVSDVAIAASLGVSRTPVREALLRLEADGLVETHRGQWTRIAPLRLERAPDLYRVVAALDALAAELAAAHISEDELRELTETNDQLRATSEPDALQTLDDRFHAVYRAYSPVIPEIIDQALFEIRRLERADFRDVRAAERSYFEHQAIVEGLRARDGARASAAARANWLNAIPRFAPTHPAPETLPTHRQT